MGGVGLPELIIVLFVVLLLFGSTKLPKLARSIGQASKEFKKGVADVDSPAQPVAEENVTMTKTTFDALVAEHEVRTRRTETQDDAPPVGEL